METQNIKKAGAILVKEGVVKAELGASYDGDQDGVAVVETGAYIKLNATELIKETILNGDQATLKAIAPFAQEIIAKLEFAKSL